MMTPKSRSLSFKFGLLVLVALVLAVGGLPNDARATVNCAAATFAGDADQDGIPDKAECDGFSFLGKFLSNCSGGQSGVDPGCVNPDLKDVFVVLVKPSSGSLFDQIVNLGHGSPFQFLVEGNDPTVNCKETNNKGVCTIVDGLGLRVHVHPTSSKLSASSRLVVPDCSACKQRAIQITENVDPSPISGKMDTYGTPTDCTAGCTQLADGIVFTKRIKDQVNGVFGDGSDHHDVWSKYIKRTLAHEILHALALTVRFNKNWDGYHHSPDETKAVMAQYVTYSTSGGVNFFIGEDFAIADVQCHLKVQADNKGNSTCVPF